MTPWWEALFLHSRAGSRTVLCDPDRSMVVEFARRGYRLVVVHSADFDLLALRQQLRELGLSSQLMGAQLYSPNSPPSLAQDFYELWIFAGATSLILWQAAETALKKGSGVYWSSEQPSTPPWGTPIENLPGTLRGVRR